MKRKHFSRAIETEILIKCKRRCALCFGFESDVEKKKGQLAHVDRDKANASKENAAFLCALHHDEYDTTSKQTKGITPDELKSYQKSLYSYLASSGAWTETKGTARTRRRARTNGISLELYDRRVPMYRTTIQFLRAVLKDLRPDLQEILNFAGDADEALFLFDETIANYLAHLLKQALRLRAVSLMLSKEWTPSLAKEDTELSAWFSEQFEEARRKFVPFLRLTS
jgi:hypothetical protein